MRNARNAPLLLLGSALAGPVTAASADGGCHSFRVVGEVRGDGNFEAALGMGLFFRMTRSDMNGWTFGIRRGHGRTDYVYLMTPPWRSRGAGVLDTSYGILAQDAVPKEPWKFWFLADPADEAAASDALDHILWPDADADAALDILRRLPRGTGTFRALHVETRPGTADPQVHDDTDMDYGEVRRIVFEVDFNVPATFKPDARLRPKRVVCPTPVAWP